MERDLFAITANGLQIAEGGDFEELHSVNQAQTLIKAQSLI
jgi:hypothetical protein